MVVERKKGLRDYSEARGGKTGLHSPFLPCLLACLPACCLGVDLLPRVVLSSNCVVDQTKICVEREGDWLVVGCGDAELVEGCVSLLLLCVGC